MSLDLSNHGDAQQRLWGPADSFPSSEDSNTHRVPTRLRGPSLCLISPAQQPSYVGVTVLCHEVGGH